MCIKAVEAESWLLYHVPDHLKTQGMRDKAGRDDPSYLQYFPDWFVTQQLLKLWHDYDDHCNDDKRAESYDGYKRRKTQKAKIKQELMPTASDPS